MAIPVALAAILKPLLGNGLNLLSNAVVAKGKDWVEKKFGIELKPDMSSAEIIQLKQAEMEHEEELMRIKLESDKLDLQELETMLKDTSDARDRESNIATSKEAPILNKIVTPLLALVILSLGAPVSLLQLLLTCLVVGLDRFRIRVRWILRVSWLLEHLGIRYSQVVQVRLLGELLANLQISLVDQQVKFHTKQQQILRHLARLVLQDKFSHHKAQAHPHGLQLLVQQLSR